MQLADPTKYTEVTQEQFDRFKNLARARGMNIGGNSDNVKFDEIPVHVEFKPDAEELNFTIHEPHWLAPGLTAGVLHTMVAAAMVKPAPQAEQPLTPAAQKQKDEQDETNNGHPAHVTRSTHATHAARH